MPESFLSSQSHKPCESVSSKSFSSLVRVMTWSSQSRVTSSHWFASSSQCRVSCNFTFFLLNFLSYEIAPNKLENGAQHAIELRPIG